MSKRRGAFRTFFEVADVGRRVAATKKRVTWRFMFEGDMDETSIVLEHSLTSGKKKVFVNGEAYHEEQSRSIGEFAYHFQINGHLMAVNIKKIGDEGYDVAIDGMSFRSLPRVSVIEARRRAKRAAANKDDDDSEVDDSFSSPASRSKTRSTPRNSAKRHSSTPQSASKSDEFSVGPLKSPSKSSATKRPTGGDSNAGWDPFSGAAPASSTSSGPTNNAFDAGFGDDFDFGTPAPAPAPAPVPTRVAAPQVSTGFGSDSESSDSSDSSDEEGGFGFSSGRKQSSQAHRTPQHVASHAKIAAPSPASQAGRSSVTGAGLTPGRGGDLFGSPHGNNNNHHSQSGNGGVFDPFADSTAEDFDHTGLQHTGPRDVDLFGNARTGGDSQNTSEAGFAFGSPSTTGSTTTGRSVRAEHNPFDDDFGVPSSHHAPAAAPAPAPAPVAEFDPFADTPASPPARTTQGAGVVGSPDFLQVSSKPSNSGGDIASDLAGLTFDPAPAPAAPIRAPQNNDPFGADASHAQAGTPASEGADDDTWRAGKGLFNLDGLGGRAPAGVAAAPQGKTSHATPSLAELRASQPHVTPKTVLPAPKPQPTGMSMTGYGAGPGMGQYGAGPGMSMGMGQSGMGMGQYGAGPGMSMGMDQSGMGMGQYGAGPGMSMGMGQPGMSMGQYGAGPGMGQQYGGGMGMPQQQQQQQQAPRAGPPAEYDPFADF